MSINPIHKGKILHGGLRFYPLCQLLFVTIKTSVIALITLKIPFSYFLLNYNLQSSALNNISVLSWLSVLLVEETEGPGENH
jgi:hypothetical protein